MEKSLTKILNGYRQFRENYKNLTLMPSKLGADQKPEIMIVSCCDSRVDPAIIFECDPGDLFVIRNIASLIPPYEKDEFHHGTSAALEFGIKILNVKHLIILGHSNCGGIENIRQNCDKKNDFISNWLSILNSKNFNNLPLEDCIKTALTQSYDNCLTFPWIQEKIQSGELEIHTWFFDLKTGILNQYDKNTRKYVAISL